MSYDYSPAAYGPGAAAYDPDLRGIDELQGGQPAYGTSQNAAAAYGSDGMDLRSIDELQGPTATGRIPAVQMHQPERGVGGFVSGVGKGFFGGAKDTVRGVVLLGKGVINTVTNPRETKNKIADWGAYAVQHPTKALGRVVSFPFRMAGAVVQPYSDAVRRGQYGQVVGRLGFDAALTMMTLKAGDALRNGTPNNGNPGGVMNGDVGGDFGPIGGDLGGDLGVGAGGAGRGGASTVSQTVNVGDVKIGNISNPGGGTININIGTNNATINGGAGGTAFGATDDAARVMSNGGGSARVMNYGSGFEGAAANQGGGFFSRLRSQPYTGTGHINPRNTFNSVVGSIDNGATRMAGAGQSVGQAFNRTVNMVDRGLSLLHPDNAIQALKQAGDAVVRVPRFIINNPGTSVKYAVAGTVTGVYTAGQMAVNGARFVITNPGHAAVLTAAAGRTAGSMLVRDEQRSDMAYDPDNPYR